MTQRRWLSVRPLALAVVLTTASGSSYAAQPVDELPSWNAGSTKSAIVAFVTRVTTPGAAFVPAPERIAVFDNDGTLWSEQPIYFQFAFAIDRVKALAPTHPEWKTQAPFSAVLGGDMNGVAAAGEKGLVELIMATHTGMSTDDFAAAVGEWVRTAKHPRFNRPYTDLVFQPMLELLAYLRHNGFKTYIVSGGTVEFMRAWTERVYGVPPEQVIGTTFETTYQARAGAPPLLMRDPKIDFIDDGPGKPVAINRFIGRRPIAAFGNSDGDLQMLQWTTVGTGPRFGLLVHHTDADREWAYDRASSIGKLDKALDAAGTAGWTVADMKRDWHVIYPFQK